MAWASLLLDRFLFKGLFHVPKGKNCSQIESEFSVAGSRSCERRALVYGHSNVASSSSQKMCLQELHVVFKSMNSASSESFTRVFPVALTIPLRQFPAGGPQHTTGRSALLPQFAHGAEGPDRSGARARYIRPRTYFSVPRFASTGFVVEPAHKCWP